ncbi:acetyl CoA synthetase subunit alpha [Candidatus Falkowbacteria bacterium CG11_big_fil_rev_8_21_14_0_20_39_10]|uniref:Acetyl CoA synthetase subunit alpha n=1 Tax=Candidatus Falkowbacteria bacterium CG11_big_fil_rev_8_21_14_0_20_39_10 TaxID=1974570 RepID=A0A2M6K8Z2_9BACT|nr:MAG: acetyl CoA synthetase subunit alpha [Candidatus Falkowbacteria bacterium CG11_big_fil_rev_8_21_14_0_20_39_10]
MTNLDKIFNPKTIAVIGASDRPGSVGNALLENLINSDYHGTVYPVNIKRSHIHAIKAFKTVKDIGEKIDLAIIATPAPGVPQIIKECGEAGVSGAVIISAGFIETGQGGEKLWAEILKTIKKYKIRVVGPNCLGFIKPSLHLNASFASQMALPGKISFISQSGALCTSILDWSIKNNVGFSNFISIGSMIDMDFADLIDYFGQDKKTDSILIYMESLQNARKFLAAARRFSRTKPILVLKAGRSNEGAQAAKSHTGAMAGNDAVFDAAFARAGIVRVGTILDLFHSAKALAMQPQPKNNRLAIITNAGGPGVLAIDSLKYHQGQVAHLSKNTIAKLDKILPPAWSRSNPVDILGDADSVRYQKSIKAVLADKNVDAILTILTPQAMTDPTEVAKKLVALPKKSGKTLLASWMGGEQVARGRQILEKGNIPIYRTPEDAISSFANIYQYSKNQELLNETPGATPHAFKPKTKENKKILAAVVKEGRLVLTEAEAKLMLANYDIPTIESHLAKTAQEAVKQAQKIGFPVVMKILSPDLTHKTDCGGLIIDIKSEEEAKAAFPNIVNSVRKHLPKADIRGVLVEPMIKKKYELMIGCKKDSIFGPAILFGMGGVAVEIFKDTTIGLPPLNMALAMRMIKETKIYKLLKGYRNMPRVDIASIQFLLYKFSYLVSDFPEIKEIDINPFAVDEYGGIALDSKIILDKKVIDKPIKPYSHLVISPTFK